MFSVSYCNCYSIIIIARYRWLYCIYWTLMKIWRVEITLPSLLHIFIAEIVQNVKKQYKQKQKQKEIKSKNKTKHTYNQPTQTKNTKVYNIGNVRSCRVRTIPAARLYFFIEVVIPSPMPVHWIFISVYFSLLENLGIKKALFVIKTKILLTQAYVTLTDFGYSV